jgi:hypothetical protein
VVCGVPLLEQSAFFPHHIAPTAAAAVPAPTAGSSSSVYEQSLLHTRLPQRPSQLPSQRILQHTPPHCAAGATQTAQRSCTGWQHRQPTAKQRKHTQRQR